MLTLRGRGVLSAALAGFVLALFTLNLIAITIAVFALTFVTAELLLFARATRTISAQSFRVGRTDLTSRLSAGGLGAARLQLRSTGPHAFYAEITDSVPEVFEPVRGDSRLITWWPEGATMTLGYVFRARARGYYAIGPTEIVARDDLGLSFRRVTLRSESWVTVSPSAPEVTLRRSTLHLAARQAGQRPVARRGYGTEFRSLRPYQEGDDYRWIAWARSRRGQLVVRQFEQESCQDF
ncbi:MAG: DUF58 domain-containing protein, partial [Thermoplasmata archaeon]